MFLSYVVCYHPDVKEKANEMLRSIECLSFKENTSIDLVMIIAYIPMIVNTLIF